MKFSCNRQELSDALGAVTRAVAAKSTHPAMEGVLLRAMDRGLYLCCYNMEMGISTEIEARIVNDGDIILNARLFTDMVRRFSSDLVEIVSDEKCMTTVRGGAAEYNIIGIPAEEFPALPEVDGREVIPIKEDTLRSMIDQTLYAVAVNDFKPVHTGAKFMFEDGALSVVAVDGFRLAIRREPVAYKGELSFIVPGKTLSEVSKLCEGENDAQLCVSQRYIIFRIGSYNVISRLLEGDFIDFRASIPQSATTVVTVDVRQTLSSIERSALLINDRLKSPIRFSVDSGEIHIACATALGKVNDAVPCLSTGEPVELGFNNRYLLEALRATGCDKVRMEITSPLSPVKIVPMEGDSFLFLVLPVRMKTDI